MLKFKTRFRKKLSHYGLFSVVWKGCRGKPLFSKVNMAAQLNFAKLHLNKLQDLWNSILWTDESKMEVFVHYAQCWKPTTLSAENTSSKLSGTTVDVWGRCSATGPGHLTVTDPDLLCIPEYSTDECEAICLRAKAGQKLGHAPGHGVSAGS